MSIAPTDTLFEEITDFLASAPTKEQIVAFAPSEMLDQRLHELLEKNGLGEITPSEREELDEFLRMNHLLKMIKLKARLKPSEEA